MSYMFEVFYRPPPDPHKEALLTKRVSALGGHFSYREDALEKGTRNICLTYEFDSLEQATVAAEALRGRGEYVEGPVDYGPSGPEASSHVT